MHLDTSQANSPALQPVKSSHPLCIPATVQQITFPHASCTHKENENDDKRRVISDLSEQSNKKEIYGY